MDKLPTNAVSGTSAVQINSSTNGSSNIQPSSDKAAEAAQAKERNRDLSTAKTA